ncbi:hypothetical protein AB4Y64_06600 [Lysobacter sp. TAF61]|uniref:hypothetical protein n=1 Tax=Lysobacter sp. TAF61 TaxID=3233072 RepID=UPI003F95028D
MRSVMAFVYFLLSLVGLAGGVDGGGTTLVARTVEDGVETVLSRTHVATGNVRFECLRSASGHCHYVLFAGPCAASPVKARAADCSFDVPVGQARERKDLPADFGLCVSHRDDAVDARCRPTG